jgi:single-stranded-DNA-specific exonuclease
MKHHPWRIRRAIFPGQTPWRRLEKDWEIPSTVARLAWLRGVDAPEDLAWRMDPSWERTWDPYLMEGMGEAVVRIRRAVEVAEPICIYGDFDVDGVTATALLMRVLERMGAQPSFFIPNRFSDGYGLHLDCIRELASSKALMISVDCGVRSVQEVAASRELGLDWIITDHHALGSELPKACAVVHPALGDHPNRTLAGVGVAFKLAQALLDATPVPRGADSLLLDGLLKLVAIGSLADMVPLEGENALLVKRGLKALAGPNGPGLACLLKAARIEGTPTAQQISFGVAPRLNAVGRMGGADDAVRLLLTKDPLEAARLAARVEALNDDRRTIQRELQLRLPPYDGSPFDFVVDDAAHKGVIGIVAGQRMRENGVPAGVCTILDGILHGSLRAPAGYDLGTLLDLASPYLLSGGGHRAAAGLSFEPSRLPFVRETLNRGAASQACNLAMPAMELDGYGLDEVPAAEHLQWLEPFGQGFPEPWVVQEGRLKAVPRAFGNGHRKLHLDGVSSELVWFNGEDESQGLEPGDILRLALSPQDHPRWGRSWHVKAVLGDHLSDGVIP